MEGSKSSAWVGVGGSVATDLVATFSEILETPPEVVTGMYQRVDV